MKGIKKILSVFNFFYSVLLLGCSKQALKMEENSNPGVEIHMEKAQIVGEEDIYKKLTHVIADETTNDFLCVTTCLQLQDAWNGLEIEKKLELLNLAITQNRDDRIKKVLSKDFFSSYPYTQPLSRALAMKKDIKLCDYLLDCFIKFPSLNKDKIQAGLNYIDKPQEGHNILHYFVMNYKVPEGSDSQEELFLKKLLENGADPFRQNCLQMSALMLGLRKDDHMAVKTILSFLNSSDVPIDMKDSDYEGNTLLHYGLFKGNIQLLKTLHDYFKASAPDEETDFVNWVNSSLRSPLHLAVEAALKHNDVNFLNILVDRTSGFGAFLGESKMMQRIADEQSLNKKNLNYIRPISMALRLAKDTDKAWNLVKLLKHSQDTEYWTCGWPIVDVLNNDHLNASQKYTFIQRIVQECCQGKYSPKFPLLNLMQLKLRPQDQKEDVIILFQYLTALGHNVSQNYRGETVLHTAIRLRNIDIINLLLNEHDINPHLRNKTDPTIMDYMAKHLVETENIKVIHNIIAAASSALEEDPDLVLNWFSSVLKSHWDNKMKVDVIKALMLHPQKTSWKNDQLIKLTHTLFRVAGVPINLIHEIFNIVNEHFSPCCLPEYSLLALLPPELSIAIYMSIKKEMGSKYSICNCNNVNCKSIFELNKHNPNTQRNIYNLTVLETLTMRVELGLKSTSPPMGCPCHFCVLPCQSGDNISIALYYKQNKAYVSYAHWKCLLLWQTKHVLEEPNQKSAIYQFTYQNEKFPIEFNEQNIDLVWY